MTRSTKQKPLIWVGWFYFNLSEVDKYVSFNVERGCTKQGSKRLDALCNKSEVIKTAFEDAVPANSKSWIIERLTQTFGASMRLREVPEDER